MKVEVFGHLTIKGNGQIWDKFPTTMCRDVMAFLVLAPVGPLPRRYVIENIWPKAEPEKCSNRMSVTLSLLRRYLGASFAEVVKVDGPSLHLEASVENQFRQFWDCVRRFRCGAADKTEAAREILTMHRAPLLVEVRTIWAELSRREAHEAAIQALFWIADETGSPTLKARAMAGCLEGFNLARAEGFEPPTPSSEDC